MTQFHESSGEFRRNGALLLAATLGGAAGLSSLPFYSLGSFIAPLEAEFGWSRGEVASFFLYTTMVLAVVAPFLGNVIDRIGTRLVALVSIPLLSAVLYAMSRFEGSIRQSQALRCFGRLQFRDRDGDLPAGLWLAGDPAPAAFREIRIP